MSFAHFDLVRVNRDSVKAEGAANLLFGLDLWVNIWPERGEGATSLQAGLRKAVTGCEGVAMGALWLEHHVIYPASQAQMLGRAGRLSPR